MSMIQFDMNIPLYNSAFLCINFQGEIDAGLEEVR